MPSTIRQVIQEYSNGGGAETVAYELSKAFSHHGLVNEVRASHLKIAPPEGTTARPLAGCLASIATRGRMRYLGRLLVMPLFSLATWINIRRQQGQIVISHGDCVNGDVMIIHAVNAASIEIKQHEGDWKWQLNPMHYWVALRDHFTIRRLRFRRYVAVSKRVKQELQHYYGVPDERIRIIPNGIDIDRFAPKPEARQPIRARYGIPADAKVLTLVGHEFRRKGLEYVIRSLAHLDDTHWLMVIGSEDPEPYRDLVPEVSSRIVFTGPQREMADFYAATDVYVFPTNYETFSLVCMEALACGVPVLATAVGGIEDYLVDGMNGYFIERDPEKIADSVRAALATPAHYADLSANARATAEAYTWDRIAEAYIALFRELDAEGVHEPR